MKAMRPLFTLIVSLGLAFAAGFLGALYTNASAIAWYASLARSVLNPPAWVFAPVWTALYILMAFAAWRVYEARRRKPLSYQALVLYAVHLFVNASWSIVFFGMHAPIYAFAIIIALVIMVAWIAYLFYRVDRVAGYCFLPYLAWVAFAAYLNLAVVLLN